MKKVYIVPGMQVEAFEVVDIITTSGVDVPEGVTADIGTVATAGEGIQTDATYANFFGE